MAKKAKKKTAKEVSFEEAVRRLDEIIDRLESGQQPLDDALASFEEGVGLLKQCDAMLKTAEQKIEILTGLESGGAAQTEDFENGPTSLDDDGATRAKKRRIAQKKRGSEPSSDESTLF